MGLSLRDSILPMSELRSDLEKVRGQLKRTPVIITNNGKPDFGVCDLETLAIAIQIRDLKSLLKRRYRQAHLSENAEIVFKRLEKKYDE